MNSVASQGPWQLCRHALQRGRATACDSPRLEGLCVVDEQLNLWPSRSHIRNGIVEGPVGVNLEQIGDDDAARAGAAYKQITERKRASVVVRRLARAYEWACTEIRHARVNARRTRGTYTCAAHTI